MSLLCFWKGIFVVCEQLDLLGSTTVTLLFVAVNLNYTKHRNWKWVLNFQFSIHMIVSCSKFIFNLVKYSIYRKKKHLVFLYIISFKKTVSVLSLWSDQYFSFHFTWGHLFFIYTFRLFVEMFSRCLLSHLFLLKILCCFHQFLL